MSSSQRPTHNEIQFLFDNTPLGYQSLDSEGRLIRVNQTWLAMLGYEEHEVLGRPIADLVVPDQRDLLAERFAAFMATGEINNLDFHIMRKDGSVCEVRVDGNIRYDADGQFLHTNCLLRDISAEREP